MPNITLYIPAADLNFLRTAKVKLAAENVSLSSVFIDGLRERMLAVREAGNHQPVDSEK